MKELLTILAFLAVVGILAHLLSGSWRRTLQVVGSWGIYKVIGWFYDYPLWGLMVIWLGNLWGSVACSVGALVINFFVLVWYQDRKVDWLGVNVLEDVKEKGHIWANRLCNHPKWYVKWSTYLFARGFQLALWLLRKNDLTAFFVLSVWQDSFVTTAFLRHGRFGKLEVRDYLILVASTLVSVVVWSFWMIMLVLMAKYGWNMFS